MMEPLRLISEHEQSPALPHNVEAEAALLGALMIDNNLAARIGQTLSPSDFYERVHADIFAGIIKLTVAGSVANPVTLRPMFDSHPAIQELGGSGYLAKLTGNGSALIGANDFAKQIAELAKRRRLLMALDDARVATLDTSIDGTSLQDVVSTIDAALNAAIETEVVTASRTFARAWDSAMTSVDAMVRGTVSTAWWVDGLKDWNAGLRGMRGGNLIVLAGRPAMGKTAVAVAVSICCARAGIGVDFFSFEMTEEELMLRAITDVCFDYDRGSFTYEMLQEGKLNATDRRRIDGARQVVDQWPLRLYEPPSPRIGRVIMEMRRRKRAAAAKGQRLDVFVIDYLQLLRGDEKRDNKTNEVADITRDLKLAAKELGVAIVLLSQLSRAVEQREDKRPVMSDLRDSGSIEQDADAVVFVFREQYYLEMTEPPIGHKKRDDWELALQASRDRLDLIFAKVRKGKTGTKKCQYFLAHQAVRGSDFFKVR